jgi:serine protease Do
LIDEAPQLDFAILKIAGSGQLFAPAPIGNSSAMSVGDEVLAIGSPFGLPQTTTFGIVSNTRRTMTVGNQTFTDFIQTDAPTNPGSSGGALVNVNGEVIGINTAIYSPTRAFSGIGFARPIDSAKAAFPDFIQPARGRGALVAFQRGQGFYSWYPPGEQMQQAADARDGRPWLGIRTRPVDQQTKASLRLPMTRGVLVSEIFAESPCRSAGLQTGDVIIRVNNRSLKDEAMLGDLLADKSIGDEVNLAVYRDGKKSNVSLRLGPRPDGI